MISKQSQFSTHFYYTNNTCFTYHVLCYSSLYMFSLMPIYIYIIYLYSLKYFMCWLIFTHIDCKSCCGDIKQHRSYVHVTLQPSNILKTRAGQLEQYCSQQETDGDSAIAHKLNELAVLLSLFGDARFTFCAIMIWCV